MAHLRFCVPDITKVRHQGTWKKHSRTLSRGREPSTTELFLLLQPLFLHRALIVASPSPTEASRARHLIRSARRFIPGLEVQAADSQSLPRTGPGAGPVADGISLLGTLASNNTAAFVPERVAGSHQSTHTGQGQI